MAERYGLTPADRVAVQLGLGSVAVSTTQSSPVLDADGEASTERASSSAGVSVGEGVMLNGSRSTVTADGEASSGSVGFGVVAREDGEVGLGASAGGSYSPEGTESAVAVERTGELTSRGASQSSKVKYSSEDGWEGALLTRGGVKIWTARQADGTYLLTCSVEVGGGLSASMGEEAKLSAGVKAGTSLVYTHTLTADEVARYVAGAEAALDGDVAADGPAELGMIASLALAGGQGAAPLMTAVGDAEAAAALGAGDSLTLTVDAGVEVGGATGGPISIGGEHQTDLQRVCTVTRTVDPETGAPRVAITVSFSRAHTNEASLTVSPGSTSAGGAGTVFDEVAARVGEERKPSAGVGEAINDDDKEQNKERAGAMGVVGGSGKAVARSGDGMGYRFLLDPSSPDYEDHYGQIVGAMTRAQLDEAAEHIKAESATKSSMWGRMLEATLSVLGLSLTSSTEGEVSEVVTDSRDGGLSGTVHGEGTDTGRVDYLDVELLGRAEEGAVTGALDGDAAAVELSMTDEERSLLALAGEEKGAPGEGEGLWARLTGLVRKPAAQAITDAITEVQQAVSVLHLSDSDLETVIARAGDRSGWLAVAEAQAATGALVSWMQLRGSLAHPMPAADYPDAAAAERVQLSRLRSLARFASETGQAGVRLLTGVAREWQGEGGRQDVGTMTMFPDSLASDRDAYSTFLGTVDASLAEDGVPTAMTAAQISALLLEGGRLQVAVEGCTAFASSRAKMEMLDALTARMDRLHLATLYADGECAGAGEVQAQQREIARLEGLLGGCKREERALLATVGGTPRGQKEAGVLGDRLDQIRDLYEHWIDRIQALRGAYDALEQTVMDLRADGGSLGLFPERRVSTPGGTRSSELEPEADGYFAARVAFNRDSMSPGLRPGDEALKRRLASY